MSRFWFAAKSPLDLAICRIVWFGFLSAYYATVDFSEWGEVDPVFWKPIPLFHILGIRPPSAQLLDWLQFIWKASLLFCCVGLFTRFSTTLAFPIGLFLLGIPHNFGKVHHFDAVVVITLAIMACSRCGDGVSIDRWQRRGSVTPSGDYRWPIRCVWLLLSMIFLAAGIAKLRASGLAWMAPENLGIKLIQHHYFYGGIPRVDWGLNIARAEWLCSSLAVATIAIECGLFLAMFHPVLRALLVPAGLAMLIGFPLLLGPLFTPLIATFVFWIPWEGLGKWLAPHALAGSLD